MKSRQRTTVLLMIVMSGAALSALGSSVPDRRPSLTGQWRRITDDAITDAASEASVNNQIDSFCGPRCAIRDDGTQLVIVREQYDNKPEVVIALDGSESRNTYRTPSWTVTMASTAKVDGDRVVINSQVFWGEIKSTSTVSVAMVKDQLLTERPLRGREPTVRKQVYSRR